MGTVALSEKTMLVVKRLKLSKEDNAPSLDDFDKEMEVYRVCIRLCPLLELNIYRKHIFVIRFYWFMCECIKTVVK